MNIFIMNTSLKTYTYPIVKISISVIIILVSVFWNKIFQTTNNVTNIIVSVVSFVLCLICIYCSYVSIAEIVYLHDVKKEENLDSVSIQISDCKQYSLDDIKMLVESNDIIEIYILVKNNILKIGSSSDYNYSKNIYFDKEYYVGKTNYKKIEDFTKDVTQYLINEKIYVVAIDGVVQ